MAEIGRMAVLVLKGDMEITTVRDAMDMAMDAYDGDGVMQKVREALKPLRNAINATPRGTFTVNVDLNPFAEQGLIAGLECMISSEDDDPEVVGVVRKAEELLAVLSGKIPPHARIKVTVAQEPPTTMEAHLFLGDNDKDTETRRAVNKLKVGDTVKLGGGAAPEVTVERLS